MTTARARRSIELADGWSVSARGATVPPSAAGRVVPTSVPATGLTALLGAGLIDDPFLGEGETHAVWAQRASWRFERTLDPVDLAADERADLVFDGIATIATVSLDGARLARSENAHRRLRVPLGDLARDGGCLVVEIDSALTAAEAELDRLGPRPAAYPHPYYLSRALAASFGWDWGPDLQPAGLWRPVRFERWRGARLARVQPHVRRLDDARWEVRVELGVEAVDRRALRVRADLTGAGVRCRSEALVTGGGAELSLVVTDPERWWPHDRGCQPLADLEVSLSDDEGELDRVTQRVGFRTVDIEQEPDVHGTSFRIVVNDEPLFVRGVNWIPDDALPDRVTPADERARLVAARDAHVNLVRVWGGGTYESDSFYDLCDELGLLVWQDVAMACAGYPEQEPLRGEILAEVAENAVRLAPHPSLALWCGGNENAWGHPQWVERGDLADGVDWGARYIDEWLPELLATVDPTRPYIPNSPFAPPDAVGDARWPNDPAHGPYHEWDVWNRDDYTRYRAVVPRFVAEFGYQAPPAWSLLARAFRDRDGDLRRESPAFALHQKADDGDGKLERGMAPHLGVHDVLEDWHAATQAMQAIALRAAIEHYRSHWPVTAGAIVWQLNDTWPAVSWSLLDSDGRPKPAWFAVRRAFADRALVVEPGDAPAGTMTLAVIDDDPRPWTTTVRVRRETLDGEVRAQAEIPVEVPARGVTRIPLPGSLTVGADERTELLVATAADDDGAEIRSVALLTEPIDVRWPERALDARAERTAEGWLVHVHARSAVLGLTLAPDVLDPTAGVDTGDVDLPAGGRTVFRARGALDADPEELTRYPVLRSIGDLARRAIRVPVGGTE